MDLLKRCLAALLLSLILAVLIGALLIPLLRRLKFGQNILKYLSEHDGKKGTPTMGGLIFLLSSFLSAVVFHEGNFYLAER